MAGSSANLPHVAASAIGRIRRHQVHALRLQQLFIIADIAIDNHELFLQIIVRNTATH